MQLIKKILKSDATKPILIFLVCWSLIIFLIIYFLWSPINKAIVQMFPTMNVSYTKNDKIMDVYLIANDEKIFFKVPKAYFYWGPDNIKDGEIKSLRIMASYKENLKPWPLAEEFENKSSSDDILIRIGARKKGTFPIKKSITRIREKLAHNFMGEYKGIFEKFDRDIIRGNNATHEFFLFPIEQAEMPFYLKCPNLGNPEYKNCEVRSRYSENLGFSFTIPFKYLENIHEYNSKVRALIKSLKVNKNIDNN